MFDGVWSRPDLLSELRSASRTAPSELPYRFAENRCFRLHSNLPLITDCIYLCAICQEESYMGFRNPRDPSAPSKRKKVQKRYLRKDFNGGNMNRLLGMWLSWESVAFATRRPWVRIPSSPLRQDKGPAVFFFSSLFILRRCHTEHDTPLIKTAVQWTLHAQPFPILICSLGLTADAPGAPLRSSPTDMPAGYPAWSGSRFDPPRSCDTRRARRQPARWS